MKSVMKRTYPSWLIWLARAVTLLYFGAIVVLSLIPGQDVPMASISDKYRHAAAYGVFAMLVSASFLGTSLWRSLLAFVAVSGVGLAIEFIQPSFRRSCDMHDALANSIGAAMGCGVLILIRAANRRTPETRGFEVVSDQGVTE